MAPLWRQDFNGHARSVRRRDQREGGFYESKKTPVIYWSEGEDHRQEGN